MGYISKTGDCPPKGSIPCLDPPPPQYLDLCPPPSTGFTAKGTGAQVPRLGSSLAVRIYSLVLEAGVLAIPNPLSPHFCVGPTAQNHAAQLLSWTNNVSLKI